MSSGVTLFQHAESLYAQGNNFDLYQASVKKILKDENVITKNPSHAAIFLDDMQQETVPVP